jgi:hypothetical protein
MKAIQRLQQGTVRRELRYAEFQAFFNGAESLFSAFLKKDYGNSPPIKITIVPGGRKGGKDKRLIEIFFGLAPYDTIAYEDRGLAQNVSFEGPRSLREAGASLVYRRDDKGHVYCILYPATTDESKVDEDMVILGIVRRPCRLNALAHSHWRDLLAYNEYTSINGFPSCRQTLRCLYLLRFCEYVENQKYQPAKVPKGMRHIAVITFSFILGGLITTTIEKRFFPDSQQTPTSASGTIGRGTVGSCQPTLPPRSNLKSSAHGKK